MPAYQASHKASYILILFVGINMYIHTVYNRRPTSGKIYIHTYVFAYLTVVGM